MKNVLVVVTIWLWSMLVPAAWAKPLELLDLEGPEGTYSKFLTDLRTELKDAKPIYDILSVMPPPSKPPTYLMVELKVSKDMSITLSLNRNDLYVVGYSDIYNKQCRYHVFPDHSSGKQCGLCAGAKNAIPKPIGYNSSYTEIQRRAKLRNGRKDLGLGVNKLKTLIPKVYGTEIEEYKDEAQFLLVAIQTISEAARFTYIEKISENAANPDDTAICLENNWDVTSKEIYDQFKRGTDKDNVIVNTCKLNQKGIANVQKIISLLCYQGATSNSLQNLVSSLFYRFATYFVAIGNRDGDETEL